jgi:hypothetical protein
LEQVELQQTVALEAETVETVETEILEEQLL